MSILAFPAVGTAPSREEEANVFHPSCIGSSEPLVALDVASRLRLRFTSYSCQYLVILKTNERHTSNNYPPYHPLPIYYTRYLSAKPSQNAVLDSLEAVNALYSLPVCGVSLLTTSPGFTCFLAGLSFFFEVLGTGATSSWGTISSEVMVERQRSLSPVTSRHTTRPCQVHMTVVSHCKSILFTISLQILPDRYLG